MMTVFAPDVRGVVKELFWPFPFGANFQRCIVAESLHSTRQNSTPPFISLAHHPTSTILCAYMLCVYICIYIYTYIYIYIYIHIYMYTHMHVYMYIYTYTHTHTYIYIQYIYKYIYLHTCTYIYTHTYIYIDVHTHTHIHKYTHTYISTHKYIYTHTHTHNNGNMARLAACTGVSADDVHPPPSRLSRSFPLPPPFSSLGIHLTKVEASWRIIYAAVLWRRSCAITRRI